MFLRRNPSFFYTALGLFLCITPSTQAGIQTGFKNCPVEILEHTAGFLDQKSWPCLFQVNQRFNALTPQGVKALQVKGLFAANITFKLNSILFKNGSKGQVYTALETLNFSESNITDEDLKDLVEFIQNYFPNIKSLNLCGNSIGAPGAMYLAALTELETLELDINRIGDEGVAHLSALIHLKWLDLHFNDISTESIQALQQALGSSVVIFY